MKVAPLNRLQYSRNLEIGINAFGLIFCPVEFFGNNTEKEKEKRRCATGPERPQQQQAQGRTSPRGRHVEGVKAEYAFGRRRIGARARARFKPDGWIPPIRACG